MRGIRATLLDPAQSMGACPRVAVNHAAVARVIAGDVGRAVADMLATGYAGESGLKPDDALELDNSVQKA